MENDSADKVSSCQKKLPSTQDPGWNDPPKWAYSPKPESANPRINKLKKRIAFPLNSSPTSSNVSENSTSNIIKTSLPPSMGCTSQLTTTPHAPLTVPSKIELNNDNVEIDVEQSLNQSLHNFLLVINKYVKDKNMAYELEQRLEIMKIMWKEKRFNNSICSAILRISEALKNDDAVTADKVHISLIMEHASVCSHWISCIRHLIQKIKENNAPVSETSPSAPYLIPNSS